MGTRTTINATNYNIVTFIIKTAQNRFQNQGNMQLDVQIYCELQCISNANYLKLLAYSHTFFSGIKFIFLRNFTNCLFPVRYWHALCSRLSSI